VLPVHLQGFAAAAAAGQLGFQPSIICPSKISSETDEDDLSDEAVCRFPCGNCSPAYSPYEHLGHLIGTLSGENG
jgi:hypothetical protein